MMICLKSFRIFPLIKRSIHIGHCRQCTQLPNAWDLMTGKERWQALQYAKGNDDPFFFWPIKRGPGTKDCPNVVISVHDKRVVGCRCTKDSFQLNYWWLHEGFPRRCMCNYWFVLERVEMPSVYDN